MSVKELTKLTVTNLWKEYYRRRDFWEVQEEAQCRTQGKGSCAEQ